LRFISLKQLTVFLCVIILNVFTTNAYSGEINLTKEQSIILKLDGLITMVEPDPKGAAGMVQAVIDIPVPPSTLWETMLDCKGANRFIKGLKRCRILKEDPKGNWDVREHVVSWLALMPTTRSEFRSDYLKNRSIKFMRTGGDLKILEGEWNLKPVQRGTKTRLTYMARIDPGTILPSSMIRAVVETDLPKTLKALRKEAIRRDNQN